MLPELEVGVKANNIAAERSIKDFNMAFS